jgi:hypothetical protein
MSFSSKAIKYVCGLKTPRLKSSGIEVINPYESDEVKQIVKKYCSKFYNDEKGRIFILGINPGRFGGGLTGIAFTDPVALREHCGVDNNLGNRKELSSRFIFSVAKKFGGVDKFFTTVFLTALYPFAIIKNKKNYNYYDEKSLAAMLMPDIVRNVKKQIAFGARRDLAILLGKKNADCFLPINQKYKFFKRIVVLEHPRYIMQYRLKQADKYIDKYISAITEQPI